MTHDEHFAADRGIIKIGLWWWVMVFASDYRDFSLKFTVSYDLEVVFIGSWFCKAFCLLGSSTLFLNSQRWNMGYCCSQTLKNSLTWLSLYLEYSAGLLISTTMQRLVTIDHNIFWYSLVVGIYSFYYLVPIAHVLVYFYHQDDRTSSLLLAASIFSPQKCSFLIIWKHVGVVPMRIIFKIFLLVYMINQISNLYVNMCWLIVYLMIGDFVLRYSKICNMVFIFSSSNGSRWSPTEMLLNTWNQKNRRSGLGWSIILL